MKTKYGEHVLKRNTKKIDEINRKQISLAKELAKLPTGFKEPDAMAYKTIFEASVALRAESDALQNEINHIIYLESHIEWEYQVNPRGK